MSEFDNIIPSVLSVKAAEGVEVSEEELNLTEGKSISQLLEDEEETQENQKQPS